MNNIRNAYVVMCAAGLCLSLACANIDLIGPQPAGCTAAWGPNFTQYARFSVNWTDPTVCPLNPPSGAMVTTGATIEATDAIYPNYDGSSWFLSIVVFSDRWNPMLNESFSSCFGAQISSYQQNFFFWTPLPNPKRLAQVAVSYVPAYNPEYLCIDDNLFGHPWTGRAIVNLNYYGQQFRRAPDTSIERQQVRGSSPD